MVGEGGVEVEWLEEEELVVGLMMEGMEEGIERLKHTELSLFEEKFRQIYHQDNHDIITERKFSIFCLNYPELPSEGLAPRVFTSGILACCGGFEYGWWWLLGCLALLAPACHTNGLAPGIMDHKWTLNSFYGSLAMNLFK